MIFVKFWWNFCIFSKNHNFTPLKLKNLKIQKIQTRNLEKSKKIMKISQKIQKIIKISQKNTKIIKNSQKKWNGLIRACLFVARWIIQHSHSGHYCQRETFQNKMLTFVVAGHVVINDANYKQSTRKFNSITINYVSFAPYLFFR